MHRLLRHLLASPPDTAGADSLDAFADRARAAAAPFDHTVDRAAAAGFAADRLGFAFAGGYSAAIARLVPALPDGARACLCATEDGGAHPRAIATRLEPAGEDAFSVSGRKTLVTLGARDATLLVVASVGADEAGRNRLRVARVPGDRAGVEVAALPPFPFAPEIPHATVTFDRVRVARDEVLDGDGYDRYLKPFRTVEDAHVLAALLGYLTRVARLHGWPRHAIERVVAAVVALRAIASDDPSRAETHVALEGIAHGVRALLRDAAPWWDRVDPAERARWDRDRPLLDVAGRARAARIEAAWRALDR